MSQLNITQLLGINLQEIFEGDVQNPQKGTFTNPWRMVETCRKIGEQLVVYRIFILYVDVQWILTGFIV